MSDNVSLKEKKAGWKRHKTLSRQRRERRMVMPKIDIESPNRGVCDVCGERWSIYIKTKIVDGKYTCEHE